MGLGKVLGQVSGLGLASKVLGGGGLNDIARNGGFGLAGLALAKKKKKKPDGTDAEATPQGMNCGGKTKMAKGGDVLSTGLDLGKPKAAFSDDGPMVQDISGKDRSEDDAWNARQAARKAKPKAKTPAGQRRTSGEAPKAKVASSFGTKAVSTAADNRKRDQSFTKTPVQRATEAAGRAKDAAGRASTARRDAAIAANRKRDQTFTKPAAAKPSASETAAAANRKRDQKFSRGYAKGGSIDGVAKRGHTKAKGSK